MVIPLVVLIVCIDVKKGMRAVGRLEEEEEIGEQTGEQTGEEIDKHAGTGSSSPLQAKDGANKVEENVKDTNNSD